MADNKRQHFVPKSTLKRFAADVEQAEADRKQINFVNTSSGRYICSASLRKQCFKPYFYGPDLAFEKSLGQMEGRFSALSRKLISTSSISLRDGQNIALMVSLQRARTLRSDASFNEMFNKIVRLAMYNRVDDETRLQAKLTVNNSINRLVGQALILSPMMLDLKQILLVNRSKIPFIIADHPVVVTNWFCRVRFPHKTFDGMARSGLQMAMPLSPTHALLLHDAGVYSLNAEQNVLACGREADIENFNDLQFLNAHKNVYIPPGTSEQQIARLMRNKGQALPLTDFVRAESVNEDGPYIETSLDEMAAPSPGTVSELIRLSSPKLPLDLRFSGIRLKSRPTFFDSGSLASPRRDPAWCNIVRDFEKALREKRCTFGDLWAFAERHPLVTQVGPWLSRAERRNRPGEYPDEGTAVIL